MTFFNKIRFELWGIVGGAIVLAGMFLSQIGFTGLADEPYSMLNHFVSELGISVAEGAWLFNSSLIVGGAILAVFLLGTGFYGGNRAAKIGAIVGVYAAISTCFVGVFTADFLAGHSVAAMGFFFGGMIAVLVFTISIGIQKEGQVKIPKKIVYPGLVVIGIFAAFLIYIFSIPRGAFSEGENPLIPLITERPAIWAMPILEWAAILGVVAWMVVVAAIILKNKPRAAN